MSDPKKYKDPIAYAEHLARLRTRKLEEVTQAPEAALKSLARRFPKKHPWRREWASQAKEETNGHL